MQRQAATLLIMRRNGAASGIGSTLHAVASKSLSMSTPVATETHCDHGQERPYPAAGWQHVDTTKKIQGPFTLAKVRQSDAMGGFRPELPMRRFEGNPFVLFQELLQYMLISLQSFPSRTVTGIRRQWEIKVEMSIRPTCVLASAGPWW